MYTVAASQEMSLRGRLCCHHWQQGPGAQNPRGTTARPLLRGNSRPDNDAWPVPLGRVGRRGAPLHGHCSSLLHAGSFYQLLLHTEHNLLHTEHTTSAFNIVATLAIQMLLWLLGFVDIDQMN